MRIKQYGNATGNGDRTDAKNSASECCGTSKRKIFGESKESHHANEDKAIRGYQLLTESVGQSDEYAISIPYMVYHFVTIHSSLRCTPAMKAGVSNRKWSLQDVVALID